MDRNRPFYVMLQVLFVVGAIVLLATTAMRGGPGGEPPSWTQVRADIAAGKVEQVVLDGPLVHLTYKAEAPGAPTRRLDVPVVTADEDFVPLLEQHGVTYSATTPSACASSAGYVVPLLVMLGLWFLLLRRDAGAPPGVATFGKSQAKLAPEEGTGVTFADVAGVEEAEEELQEIVQFLKTPEKFTSLGGKIPKGVLLVGPPGTGKTLLARAVAGEAGVPFFSISGSDFVEMFVGVGAARVRDLFKQASDRAPCIIFIDELDAVGKARGGSSPVGGHDEREQTLNQLLVEMDGFDGRKGIIIMAATNRPEILDPALLRAGRFDRQVLVDRPDVTGREAILRVHAKSMKLAPSVDLNTVARMTPGFAGADLANALNEAALLAARQNKEAVELSDIEAAIERIVAGLEKKSRRLSPREKRVVAFHEAGHAICAAVSPGADPVQKISIIPRGIGALGYTLQTPLEDRYLMSRAELRSRLVVLYGGRTAEELFFEDFTTGASDDIRRASDLARRMVTQFGMSDALGPVDYGGERPNPLGIPGGSREIPLSEETARQIDVEVRRLLDDAHAQARRILSQHRALLERMAAHLLEREVLDKEGLSAFLSELQSSSGFAEETPGASAPRSGTTGTAVVAGV